MLTASDQIAQFIGWDHRARARKWKGEQAQVCEVKYDGLRMTIWRDECDEFAAYGRRTATTLWAKLFDCLVREDIDKVTKLPKNTVIDGEIHIPGNHAVATSLNDGVPNVEFQAFACPFVAGVDCRAVPFAGRDRLLRGLGFTPPQSLSAWPRDELSLRLLADEMDIAGFVLKQAHCRGWYASAKIPILDAIVHDFDLGGEGRIGALHLALFDGSVFVQIGKVGCYLHATDDPTGRCVQVAHAGPLRNGRLRFPRFLRWQDDKGPRECGLEQL
jgi:ATP-dependent DNA ligase